MRSSKVKLVRTTFCYGNSMKTSSKKLKNERKFQFLFHVLEKNSKDKLNFKSPKNFNDEKKSV